MQIEISYEGAAVLHEFADVLPGICDDLELETHRLIDTYHSVGDLVGPHGELFLELLTKIRQIQGASAETLTDLSHRMHDVAYMIEQSLGDDTPQSGEASSYEPRGEVWGEVLAEEHQAEQQHAQAVFDRLYNGQTTPIVLSLYQEYESKIAFGNQHYFGVPCYNSSEGLIYLNVDVDLQNELGAATTYFHEVGHFLDDTAGNGHACLSSDPEFGKALRDDADAYFAKVMQEYQCDILQAYDIVSDELYVNVKSGVSDIFGALTDGKCSGIWGHERSYWTEYPPRIEAEAFAHMFEASVGNAEKLETLRMYFPNAYRRFEYIIRSR